MMIEVLPLRVAQGQLHSCDSSTSKNAATHSAARLFGVVAMQQQQPSLSDLVSSARTQISAALALLQTQVARVLTMMALQPPLLPLHPRIPPVA
jgi:hypothetical protein